MMRRIVGFLVRRALITNIICLAILSYGAFSAMTLSRQAYPQVDLDRISIETFYPGAASEDVERNVTKRIEDAIADIRGIDHFTSRTTEGFSSIHVFIDADAPDQERVKSDVRHAVDGVSELPEEIVNRPKVNEWRIDDLTIYEIAIVGQSDLGALTSEVERLKERLESLELTGKVSTGGLPDREIRLKLDANALRNKNVTIDEVISAVEHIKIRLGAGSLSDDVSEQVLITYTPFPNTQDLGQIIIRSTADGYMLRLKDVASIVDDYTSQRVSYRYNGKPATMVYVTKKSRADVIRTVRNIEELLEDFRETLPDEFSLHTAFDLSLETRVRLAIVTSNAALGFFLVLVVLFFFLNWRIAFWAAFGIPVAIAAALIAMPLFDITINSISLCGMIVILGMVVDDAIIVAESIYRSAEEGQPAEKAAVNGLFRVILPVLTTIVTTITAFIPIYFIPGVIGQFSQEIPTIVIIVLTASFLEATFILPAHLGQSLKKTKTLARPPGYWILKVLENGYVRTLEVVLRLRYFVLVLLFSFIGFGWYCFQHLSNFELFPRDQAYQLLLRYQIEEGSSLERTKRKATLVEEVIDSLPEGVVLNYRSLIGVEANLDESWVLAANSFLIRLTLSDANQRSLSAMDVERFLLENTSGEPFDAFTSRDVMILTGGPLTGKPVEIRFRSNDDHARSDAVISLINELSEVGVRDVEINDVQQQSELHVLPDIDKLGQAQVSASNLAHHIRTAIDGYKVTYRQEGAQRIPVRVQIDTSDTEAVDSIMQLVIRNKFGNFVPISQLVTLRQTESRRMVYRYNGARTTIVSGSIDRNQTDSRRLSIALEQKINKLRANHPEVHISIGGETKESADFMQRIFWLIAAAFVGVYLILVINFNSLTLPVLVVVGIPIGVVGIVVAFVVQGLDLSLLALEGVVGFVGVVVNDSLIMVDRINRLRGEDFESHDEFTKRVIEGARFRLRPILLTTITTVAGLLPTAYGFLGGTDSFVSPLVMSMAWGLLFGTPAILIVIPVIYACGHDAQRLVLAIKGQA